MDILWGFLGRGRQATVEWTKTATFSISVATSSEPLEVRPKLLYGRLVVYILYSPSLALHWPENGGPRIILNGHFTLNSVFAPPFLSRGYRSLASLALVVNVGEL